MKLQQLTRWHRREAMTFLNAAPMANLFQLGLLEKQGVVSSNHSGWMGVWEGPQLRAVSVSFGRFSTGQQAKLIVADGEHKCAVLLGQHEALLGGGEFIVGPREGSDGLLEGLNQGPASTYFEQRLYVCRPQDLQTPTDKGLEFRPAKLSELSSILMMSAHMMIEDLGYDPRAEPKSWEKTVEQRIREGRCLIGLRDTEIVFILDVGASGGRGCQVGGTYVPPEHRGQGISTTGMMVFTKKLLNRFPVVTLHVNEANTAAVRCYERAGYRRGAPFRLAIY